MQALPLDPSLFQSARTWSNRDLASRDLIFTSKVTGTARELGYRVLVAGNSAWLRR